MKKRNRIIAAGVLAVSWAASIAALKAWLAPATGAVVVNEMDASNAGYFALAGLTAGGSLAIAIASAIFVALIVAVLRSK